VNLIYWYLLTFYFLKHTSLSSSVNEKTQSLPDLMPLRLLWLKQKKSHYDYLVKSTQSEGGNGNIL